MFTPFTNHRPVLSRLKKVALLLAGAVAMFSNVKAQQYVNTTATGVSCNSFPFNTTSPNNTIQWLITAGEFTGAPSGRAITTLYIRPCTAVSLTYNLTIKMGSSSLTSFTAGSFITGLTTVFTGSVAMSTTANGWFALKLTTPYVYDPKKSLIIEINNSNITSGGFTVNQYTPGGNRRLYGGGASSDTYGLNAGIDTKSLAANDAGIEGLVSPVNFCAGTYDLKVTAANTGTKQIKGLTINWSLNGTAQTPITYSSTLDTFGGSGARTATITLSSYTWTASTVLNLKVWTSNPNSTADGNTANDTLVIAIKPSLSGTYTVGGSSPNYSSLTAAINDLVAYGMCGPVTLDVRAGTYTGFVNIKQISGQSATNTLTIKGASASSTTLTYSSTSATDAATIVLDGADYTSISDFTINNTGVTYGAGVILTNAANYNTIKNCVINVSTTSTSANVFGIAGTGSTASPTTAGSSGNYNIITGNTITGGYYGLTFWGASTASYAMGNQYLNNTIKDYYSMGMYLYYGGEEKIIGNKVTSLTRNTTAYGIYFLYHSNYQMSQNEVNTTYYGVYCYYTNYYLYNTAGTATTMNNNIFNSSTLYGLYSYYFYYASMHHNTARGAGTYYGGLVGYALTSSVVGNIFWGAGTGYAFYTTSGTYTSLDYNIYYAPSATALLYVDAITYTNLASWQTAAPKLNAHSLQQDPKLKSATDLHIDKTISVPYAGVTQYLIDVDGDARCSIAPTIGADESPLGKNLKPTAGITGPDTVFVNSPVEFLGNQTAGVPHGNRWYVDGSLLKDSTDLLITLGVTGLHTVKVVAYGCTKSDSVTKNVRVINPTSAPVVDFVASQNSVRLGDKVTFSDLSSGGPTKWSWDITPKSTYDNNGNPVPSFAYTYGTATSRSPVVRFDAPGLYKVCLTATNSQGSNTVCKTAYIRVLPGYNMALTPPIVTENEGYIYDNGGANGIYSNSLKSGIQLAPCAAEVYLIVKTFELECGYDFLRIYDGADNKGKALHPCTSNTGTSGLGPGLSGTTGSTCATFCRPATTDTFKAKSGKMFLEMSTDVTGQYNGFEAYWWVKPKKVDPPVADFDFPKSVCVNIPVSFTNKSTGETMQYQWDLDDDMSNFETTSKDAAYAYFSPGKYVITLIVTNCGGVDTIQKELTVISPSKPSVSFTADNVYPTTNDIVKFSPDISVCVEQYTWRFKAASGPGKAIFVSGTKASSSNPSVVFTDTGCYSAYLYAKNAGGDDSLELSCYIRVKSAYCMPTVTTNVPDLGIAEVSIANLKNESMLYNKSSQGIEDYQNFTPTVSASLEKGVAYDLKVSRNTNQNQATRTVWIDWNLDGDFNDAGEKVGEEKKSSNLSWTLRFTVPTSANIGASVMRVAINQGNLTNSVCGPNKYGEYEDYRIYVGPFITPPVITMKGDDTAYVEQGYVYADAGATATSILYGSVSVTVKQKPVTFDNMIPGIYMFEYNAVDPAGNRANSVSRVVIVTPDITPPQLIVSKKDTVYANVFDVNYGDPEALLAEDLVDGDLLTEVIKAGGVNINKVGTYFITFSVSDQTGNKTMITRVIIVQDLETPKLTITGKDTVYVEVNSKYTDGGATATDNYCDNAATTADILSTGNVNIAEPGTYTIVYNVTDCNGNKADAVIRTVIVQDTKAPDIALKDGKTSVTMNVLDTYDDKGVIASDNYGVPTVAVTGTYYAAFPNGKATALGTYTIIYTATDKFNNQASVTRTIEVVDVMAPVITLKGAPTANVCRWGKYVDASYTVTDNFYTGPDVTVTTEGDFVNTMQEGMYSFRYVATDKSMNKGHSEWRIIRVVPAGEGGCLTGLNEGNKLDSRITLFPNPSTGRFTVKVQLDKPEQVSVKVINALGQTVASQEAGSLASYTLSMDLSAQAGGVYMLYITAGNQTSVKQIVITK